MRPSHSRPRVVFDDPNLLGAAGLVPALALARAAGLDAHLAGLGVPIPKVAAKITCVVAGMLAGADSIDDLDLLRHGAMCRVFTGVAAPSTLGTALRAFTHGHVQQLDRAGAALLAGLGARVPGLLGGDAGVTFLDVDDTVRTVHGYAKQAAGFGYTRQRGLNIQLATISTPTSAPVVARARLRRGSCASATGVGRLLAQAHTTATAAGVTGSVVARADSAYYGWAFVGTAVRRGITFSVTARQDPAVRAAIASIPEDAWTPITYPQAVYDEHEQRWISDAQVAETPFTAFTSRRKTHHVHARLVVRRVRRLGPGPGAGAGAGQGELFDAWRHHAFLTNAPHPTGDGGPQHPTAVGTVAADVRHRAHAVIEQVIAELKDGALAHLPSGSYAANAAWVSAAVMAFNLARATATAAGLTRARWATVRTRIINVPARLATRARRQVLHLPTHWPWATAWARLWDTVTATGPPAPART